MAEEPIEIVLLDPAATPPSVESDPAADLAADLGQIAQKPYYLEHWRPLLTSGGWVSGFNLPAALFMLAWSFYRKLYLVGTLALLAEFLAIFVAAFIWVLIQHNIGEDKLKALGYIVVFAVRIAYGFLANGLYLRHARRQVERLRQQQVPDNYRGHLLRDHGGTSIGGLCIAIAIGAALYFVGL